MLEDGTLRVFLADWFFEQEIAQGHYPQRQVTEIH
ncbi:protein of unknown function [Acidithiobacillus ferrivorans]|uniref:Uncharacterized protein n=1 Tax=Acidithiobacillus ferrivorans TaxID=160808 RepID=A0A060UUT9_9PROT|nr:hypothetical protein AFERRI_80035 [Acidithiobacillus ferrivorans]SMH64787.1 protein of unknown function [Acidithiobacillus ferrivorans]